MIRDAPAGFIDESKQLHRSPSTSPRSFVVSLTLTPLIFIV